MSDPIQIIAFAGFLFLAAFLLLLAKGVKCISPFHFCFPLFSAECFLVAWPQMPSDPFGRTQYWELGGDVAWSFLLLGLLSVAISAAILVFKVRPAGRARPAPFIRFRIPLKFVFGAAFVASLSSSAVAFARLGTFPVLALSSASPEERLGYNEVFQGFLTFSAWGGTRLMAVLLGVVIATWREPLQEVFRRHVPLFLLFAASIMLNLLDGQRNLLVFPVMILVFALGLRGAVTWKAAAIAGMLLFASFVGIGYFRAAEVGADRLIRPSGIRILDYSMGWVIAYLEPNIFNLNNLHQLPPEPTYGGVLLSQLVPNSLFGIFMAVPQTAPEYMESANLYSQPGLTFRSLIGDLLPDFGLGGATFLSGFLLVLGAVAYLTATRSPHRTALFLILSVGLMAAPLLNMFVSIVGLIPFLALWIIRADGDCVALSGRTGRGSQGSRPLLEVNHASGNGIGQA